MLATWDRMYMPVRNAKCSITFFFQAATGKTAAYWGRTPITPLTQNKNSAYYNHSATEAVQNFFTASTNYYCQHRVFHVNLVAVVATFCKVSSALQ